MELAGQHTVLDHGEARQVCLHVRAPALDPVAGRLPGALRRPALCVEALGVLQPLLGQALEPRIDVVVVGTLARRAEAHRQEELVDPVGQPAADARLDEVARDREPVARRLVALRERTDLPLHEVRHDLLVAQVEHDALVDSGADQVGLFQERIPPRLELREDVEPRPLPRPALRLDHLELARLVGLQVGDLVLEDRVHLRGWQGMLDLEPVRRQDAPGSRQHELALELAPFAHVVEEHGLVGEDVVWIVMQVVELEELRVEEARRAGRRHRPAGRQDLDVAVGARHLRHALLVSEHLERLLGELVDHRIPDGA